ncbi:MAG: primosomal protein N' [Leptolyngbya foveolarum]|uniref:Replication restart protein PriA n=1 Tax=Leptolyngbya foveolarum TaxID=47253 RepID=A0A2W4UDY4_9CYAN|nr:MAG: primosomal protein N' [Leptolyngbya foveolarum]
MDELIPTSRAKWIEVLVDCPGAKSLYTYQTPDDTEVWPGDIVNVPFGRAQVGGIAVRQITALPEGLTSSSVKPIESVVNSSFFTKEYWRLLVRIARYYQTPFVRVIRTALPPGLLSRSQRRVRLSRTEVSRKNRFQDDTKNNLLADRNSGEQGRWLLSKQMVELIERSPTQDYSWQYVQRQMQQLNRQNGGKSVSRKDINQALQSLIRSGVVESYLETPRSPQAQKRQAVFLVNTAPNQLPESSSGDSLTQRQQEIVKGLAREGGELWLSDALQILNTTSKTLKKIADLGYVVIEPKEVLRAGSHSRSLPDRAKTLTADQAAALAVLQQMQGYEEALLHGVTGSGKTEVYLQAIAPILAAQKSALVLVPEIGLTPQLTDRFRSRFGNQVCVYHSGLSEGERYDTWRKMLTGEPQVIIGTRSAVFSPLPNLGMIILDEEHDGSFKQDQPMPCYHARKVARWRAELEDCPLILGSATPSIETWVRFHDSNHDGKELASSPKRHYLSLPMRVHARPAPPVEIVDMRKELLEGNRTIFSRPLQLALEAMIEQGNQGILFIHRRGHSSFVSCRSCGHVMECPNCDVSLSFHQTHQAATARLKCHYCGHAEANPKACPACASPYIKNFGSGTQRVVNDLAKYLPQARCIRFDSDTTRNKGAHRALLARFAQGEADLLVGTQMLTKGIDLPQVTLVGAIAADGLLFMPDYRASERAFQTLTQVAGRAGRGKQEGRVIVQTYSPEHEAIKALTHSSVDGSAEIGDQKMAQIEAYGAFLQAEMGDRADQQYPPYGRLILLRLSGLEAKITERTAEKLAEQLQQQLSQPATELPLEARSPYRIMGPVPAPIFRVARRYRWHILIKLSLDAPLPALEHLQDRCPKGVSLTIDVEPLNLS